MSKRKRIAPRGCRKKGIGKQRRSFPRLRTGAMRQLRFYWTNSSGQAAGALRANGRSTGPLSHFAAASVIAEPQKRCDYATATYDHPVLLSICLKHPFRIRNLRQLNLLMQLEALLRVMEMKLHRSSSTLTLESSELLFQPDV